MQRWHAPATYWEDRSRNKSDAQHQYAYHPLSESDIRVLFIHPSDNFQDPIQGTIKHGALHSTGEFQPYLTLSYTWGKARQPFAWGDDVAVLDRTIYCESKPMRVTSNLEDALRFIRSRFYDITETLYAERPDRDLITRIPIWIDAICINQLDAVEKTKQVARMAEIYSNASRLVVWLGTPNPPLRPELQEVGGGDIWGRYSNELKRSGLFESRWFKRRWTIQEYRLTPSFSRYFLFGQLLFDGREFGKQQLRLGHKILDYQMRTLPAWVQDNAPQPPREKYCESFLFNMFAFDGAQCTNPHDLVYAVISLAAGSREIENIDIDYSQSVETLFCNVARSILNASDEKLDLLAPLLALASSKRHTFTSRQVPSWVPDWRTSSQYRFKDHTAAVEEMMGFVALDTQLSQGVGGESEFHTSEHLFDKPLRAISGQHLVVAGRFLAPCFPPRHERSYRTPHSGRVVRCWTCEYFEPMWLKDLSVEAKEALSIVDGERQFLFVMPRADRTVFVLNRAWPPSAASADHFEVAYCVLLPVAYMRPVEDRREFFASLDTITIE